MAQSTEQTRYVCLFHHRSQAEGAVSDLLRAGISRASITVLGTTSDGSASTPDDAESLRTLGVPDHDLAHLRDGLKSGGVILAVDGHDQHADKIEQIFHKHAAGKIDETASSAATAPASTSGNVESSVIPVVDEQLVVGKREVKRAAVRVFSRTTETPVEKSVSLREEHVYVDRRPANRPVTDADLRSADTRLELTEMSEEAVIAKNARVVEEVTIGKDSTENTERVSDTVRHTEVEVEQLDNSTGRPNR